MLLRHSFEEYLYFKVARVKQRNLIRVKLESQVQNLEENMSNTLAVNLRAVVAKYDDSEISLCMLNNISLNFTINQESSWHRYYRTSP